MALMKYILPISCFMLHQVNALNPIFMSMELNIPWAEGNDRSYNPYHQKSDLFHYNKEMLSRRSGFYPLVEFGPGSFKAEHKKMSPDYLKNQFKKLLAIKKKMDESKNSY